MAEGRKRIGGRSRLVAQKTLTPEWFGWLGVVAMVLLTVVRIVPSGSEAYFFPLLSLGEWLLVPLGTASLSLGLLTLYPYREKTLLPLWVSAVVPAVVWLATAALSILLNRSLPSEGDMMLAWVVRLVFPVMAFLPLLAQRTWRNRLMWALMCGVAANVALIGIQIFLLGSADMVSNGGFLSNQHDYGTVIAIALPLLATWRGGEIRTNRAFVILLCTFLLPAIALGACFTASGLIATAVGLATSWAAWRSPGWIMGIFLCLLIFGYGAQDKIDRDTAQRQNLVASVGLGKAEYADALAVFTEAPFFGNGPGDFLSRHETGDTQSAPGNPQPWYATLLGGSGLFGLGLWLALLAELAARALGRRKKRSLWAGGVLGATAALAVTGLWTDALPEGGGALVGLLLAISILEEPDTDPSPRRAERRREREVRAKVEAAKSETIIRLKKEGALPDDSAKTA